MPIQDIKGLQGLKGWTELTDEERESWLDAHPKYRGLSTRQMLDGYANQNFVDMFGRENFAKYDRRTRDSIYRNAAIDAAARETFKDDDNLDTIMQMTPDAKMELFESDYLDKQAKEDKRREDAKTSSITTNKKGFDIQDIIDPFGIGRGTARKAEEFQANITEKSKDNILADINARDLYRKKDAAGQRQLEIASMYKSGLESGQISEDDVRDAFSKIADGSTETYSSNLGELSYDNPGSRVYKAYKNSHEMADFGLQDMIDTISEYQAMRETYGTQDAQQYLDTKIQDYVADHQNVGDWVGAAFQGAATKFASNLMGVYLFLESMEVAATRGEEGLANWIEGKDKNGNDLPLWHNPQYWNGVDQFGSFSPEFLNKVRNEYGGISKYNWITPVGKEMNFANTMNEAAKMAGYMAAGMLVSRGVGAEFKGLSSLAEKAGSKAAKKALEASAPYAIAATNAMGISEAYALGTYDQILQEANETIDNKRYADAQKYAERTIQTNGAVQGMLDEYVRQRSEEILKEHPELKLEDLNEQALYNEGLQQYSAVLQQQYLEDHNADYDEDREAARRAGAAGYMTDAILEELRMFTSGLTYKKWMMSKADRDKTMNNLFNKRLDRKAVDTAGGLVGKTMSGKDLKWGTITPVLNNIWGGARDNYLDDVTVAFAKGFALDKFNNYFESGLSPKEYAAVTDGIAEFISGVVAGAAQAELSMIDKQSFHDGLVGGLGGAVTIAPRFANIIQRRAWGELANYDKGDVMRAALDRNMSLDIYLNNKEAVNEDIKANKLRKMNGVEVLGEYVFNPLLQDYTDAVQRNRDFQYEIDTANKVIADNIPKINEIALGNAILNENLVAEKAGSLADLKDSQTKGAVFYASQLERMRTNPIYSQSMQVQEEIETLERRAKGDITEKDITEFLNNPDNKSVKESPNAVQIATERLQKNAQQLNQIRQAYTDAMKVVKESPDYQLIAHENKAEEVATQLVFNNVMYSNRQERIASMENDLRNISQVSETSSPIALYGSEKGRQDNEAYYQKAVEDQSKYVENLKKVVDTVKNTEVKGRLLKEDKRYKEQAFELQLKEEERRLSDLKAKLEETRAAKDADFSRVLSEDEIMALNPIERAQMFQKDSRADYSPAQKKVIDKLANKLIMRNPSLLQTIQDSAILTQRNEDIVVANSIMNNNLRAAVSYYQYAEAMRKNGVNEVWNKRLRDEIDAKLESINLRHEATLRREAKKFNSSVLSDYIDRHPEAKDALMPTLKLVQLREYASDAIMRMFDGDMAKLNKMRKEVNSVVSSPKVRTEADAMSILEDVAENYKNTQQEKDWDELIVKLQEAKYTRDATKAQTRSERRKEENKAEKPEEKETAGKSNTAQVERTETTNEHHYDDPTAGAGINLNKEFGIEKKFDEDGSVKEPTPEELEAAASRNSETPIVKLTEDPEKAANTDNVSSEVGMIGNILYEYDGNTLRNSGVTYDNFQNKTLKIAVRKTPYKTPSALTAYYQWEDIHNFNIQQIIDDELGKIMDVSNDNLPPIHFIKFKDSGISSINTVIFNAVEFTDRVKSIHGQDNKNGVILIGDRQYLVIGTLGYDGKHTEMKESYDTVNKSFDDTAIGNKEYYTSPYTTKFDDIYAGYLVDNYGNTDDVGEPRTIKSLLADKATNPHGITYDNAVWGITYTKNGLVIYGKPKQGKRIFPPRNLDNNVGVVFLMTPSSNGNYIPIALEPANIGDLKNGSQLKKIIEQNVRALTNEDKAMREEALRNLSDYLVFIKGVQEIKFADSSHTDITVVKNEGVALTYKLNDPNARDNLLYEVMQATPFRVNVSPLTLTDKGRLEEYDEAGALRTTAAKLGTVNTTYTVLRVDENGKPIERVEVPAPVPPIVTPAVTGTKVHYLGKEYTIAPDKQVYDINGRVLNERSAFAVRASNYIFTQNLSPEYVSPAGDKYYRISPQVVVFIDTEGKVWQIKGDRLDKYNIRLEQEKKDSLAKEIVKNTVVTPTAETITNQDLRELLTVYERELRKPLMDSGEYDLAQDLGNLISRPKADMLGRQDRINDINRLLGLINSNSKLAPLANKLKELYKGRQQELPKSTTKLSIVSDNTDKSYNFTQEMRNARSATYKAVGEFLTKKGIKDVKGLTIKQMKEELSKYKVSLDTVTDEKSFIDMLNNCL